MRPNRGVSNSRISSLRLKESDVKLYTHDRSRCVCSWESPIENPSPRRSGHLLKQLPRATVYRLWTSPALPNALWTRPLIEFAHCVSLCLISRRLDHTTCSLISCLS